MIKTDQDIRHGLAHLEIGERAVQVTIAESRFSAEALTQFFSQLRSGHRAALSEHGDQLAAVIGNTEHDELDQLGIFGQFAGRMAIKESGLAIVESALHHSQPAALQEGLRASLQSAVATLRS